MPDVLKAELFGLIWYLLPGFVAAWIFHSLTPHPKSTPFERIILALVFTAISRLLGVPVKSYLGPEYLLAMSAGFAFALNLLGSIVVGLFFAWSANNSWFHKQLYGWNFTSQLSHPSVWVAAFADVEKQSVVLHLKGDKPRRLMGQIKYWPDQNEFGHIVLSNPEWILDLTPIKNPCVEKILVAACDVEMVEFLVQPVTTVQLSPPPPKK